MSYLSGLDSESSTGWSAVGAQVVEQSTHDPKPWGFEFSHPEEIGVIKFWQGT